MADQPERLGKGGGAAKTQDPDRGNICSPREREASIGLFLGAPRSAPIRPSPPIARDGVGLFQSGFGVLKRDVPVAQLCLERTSIGDCRRQERGRSRSMGIFKASQKFKNPNGRVFLLKNWLSRFFGRMRAGGLFLMKKSNGWKFSYKYFRS